MSTPIAMTASNGELGMGTDVGAGVLERDVGLKLANGLDEPPNPRPPRRSVAVAPAWTCAAEITL